MVKPRHPMCRSRTDSATRRQRWARLLRYRVPIRPQPSERIVAAVVPLLRRRQVAWPPARRVDRREKAGHLDHAPDRRPNGTRVPDQLRRRAVKPAVSGVSSAQRRSGAGRAKRRGTRRVRRRDL